jgi:hypothetical protein
MQKIDIYTTLGMNHYFEGDAFKIGISNDVVNDSLKINNLLFNICERESLNQLGDGWNSIDFETCSTLLLNALTFDLAYKVEYMPKDNASSFHNSLINTIHADCVKCFTNWDGNPWLKQEGKGSGWSPITNHTFDMAIAMIDKHKIIFVYFISED